MRALRALTYANPSLISARARYDDSPIGGHDVFDENYSDGLYDEQWRTVQEYEDEGNLSIVAIYSWNEYHERSQIEPYMSPDRENITLPFSKTYDYIQTVIQTVPEFSSLLVLLLFKMAMPLAIITFKRKHRQ